MLLHKASFINQRHDGPILHTVGDGVLVDQFAELGHGIFFFFHQRCSGESDVAGVGEHSAHLGGQFAIIGTVALVHQQEHIPGEVLVLQFFGGVKLVDDGSDHVRLAAFQQLHQVPPAGGPGRIQTGVGKGGGNLPVQFFPVGDNDHLGITVGELHQQVFGQHDHGQAFAAALGVPDDAALPVAPLIQLLNSPNDLLDRKVLLVTADFLHIGVKKNKIADQFQHPLRSKQGNQVPVLLRRRPARDMLRQGLFQKGGVLLFPDGPELFGCVGGGVFHCIFVGGHHNLGKLVELGDVLRLLVADGLLHCLLHADLGGFALDGGKGDAIDEKYQIRYGFV